MTKLDGEAKEALGSKFAGYANLPLRLLVGYGFIEHGFAKLSRGPDVFASILKQLGVPLPDLAAGLTIGTEILGAWPCCSDSWYSGRAFPWLSSCWGQ